MAGKFFKIPGIEDFYKKDDAKPLIFCHFAGGISEEKVYNDITDVLKAADRFWRTRWRSTTRPTPRWTWCCSKTR